MAPDVSPGHVVDIKGARRHLPVPEQLLRHLTDDCDLARASVERLTTELAGARQQLERREVTHKTLPELAGAVGPPPTARFSMC